MYLVEVKIHSDHGGNILTVVAGFSIIGRLYLGSVVDRLGGRKTYLLCLAPLVLSLLAFAGSTHSWMLFVVGALYGFAHGGVFTVVSPTIAEFFDAIQNPDLSLSAKLAS